MRLLILFALLPGCVFFGDDDGDDDCLAASTGEAAPAPQRNPETLQCETYGGGCNESCGPCPLFAPEVTWGICGSPCEALGESACAADPTCRVATYADCEISLNCLTNFLGCFPVDQTADTSVSCWNADSWECSRSNECKALHSSTPCPADDAQCDRPFELCAPEDASPGRCHDPATCRALPPQCPTGTTPGVSNMCWTGACIPNHLCEPAP